MLLDDNYSMIIFNENILPSLSELLSQTSPSISPSIILAKATDTIKILSSITNWKEERKSTVKLLENEKEIFSDLLSWIRIQNPTDTIPYHNDMTKIQTINLILFIMSNIHVLQNEEFKEIMKTEFASKEYIELLMHSLQNLSKIVVQSTEEIDQLFSQLFVDQVIFKLKQLHTQNLEHHSQIGNEHKFQLFSIAKNISNSQNNLKRLLCEISSLVLECFNSSEWGSQFMEEWFENLMSLLTALVSQKKIEYAIEVNLDFLFHPFEKYWESQKVFPISKISFKNSCFYIKHLIKWILSSSDLIHSLSSKNIVFSRITKFKT